MGRRVFFSFHYKPDSSRASQVRNMGALDGNQSVSDNDWEAVTKGGDAAIKTWIDTQLTGRSCVVVLIGSATAGRKWISYEISTGWNQGKGVVGIYIHHLKNLQQQQSRKGPNPLDYVTMTRNNAKMSTIAKAYDPPYTSSTDVYKYINNNIGDWVERAITIRKNY